MLNDKMIEKLEAKGFKRWTKGTMDRLYVNADKIGLDVDYYKTGNVSSAWLNGEKISNSEARAIMGGKYYVDVTTGEVNVKVCGYHGDEVRELIEKIVVEAAAEAETEEKPEEAEEVKAEEAPKAETVTAIEEGKSYTVTDYFAERVAEEANRSISMCDVFGILKETDKAIYAMLNIGARSRKCMWVPKCFLVSHEVGKDETGAMHYETKRYTDYEEAVSAFQGHWNQYC